MVRIDNPSLPHESFRVVVKKDFKTYPSKAGFEKTEGEKEFSKTPVRATGLYYYMVTTWDGNICHKFAV